MKKFISIFLSLIILLSLTFVAAAETGYLYSSDIITQKSDFHLIAHRGVSSLAPENSLSAVNLAGKYGYWGCEFDVQSTSDGKWVLMHDLTIDRMTNGSGFVSGMTYSTLSKYKIDTGSNIEKYADEKIPEISEALDICKKHGMKPVIEIKSGTTAQIKNLCTLLNARKEKSGFIIASLMPDALKTVRENMPKAKIWLIVLDVTDYSISLCQKYNFEAINTQTILTSSNDIIKLQAAGIIPAVWTSDSVKEMEKLYSMGVKYVETNDVLPLASADAQEIIDSDSIIRKVVLLVEKIINMILSLFSIN